jgi:hypothetical protein
VDLLRTHRPELGALVDLLLEKETVDGSDVYRLAGQPDKSASTSPAAPPAVMAPHPAGDVTSADGSATGP